MIFDRFQLHHFASDGEDQYSNKAATTCSTGLTFYIFDLCAETGGEAAPTCACDFSLEKSEYYVHTQNRIHI